MEAPAEVAAAEREARNDDVIDAPLTMNSLTVSMTASIGDDDDDGDVCRICRNPADADRPLRYPCACSGSIKYVHQDCLLMWLNHSNARHCEVCKHRFSFSPVYAENAPTRLPFREFLTGMAMKACSVLQFFLRLAFVLSVWLLIIPFISFWIWRLSFVRSLGEAHVLFLSHISTPQILTDCLHGFLLSASIVFVFLGATSLRDYFRHLREQNGHEADRDDDVPERAGARLLRRPNRMNAGEVNGDDPGAPRGIAGAGQIIRRNAENVAAQLEMQAARLEAHVEQMFDGLDDADGAEDVPFDELVGMQGPIFHLVENAITVLASNAIFLGVMVFIPFTIGRMMFYALSWFLSSSSLSSFYSAMLSAFPESAVSITNETLKAAVTTAKNLSDSEHIIAAVADATMNNTGIKVVEGIVNASSSNLFRTSTMSSRISDATTIAVGYTVIFSLVLFYLGLVAVVRYSRGEPLTNRRLTGVVPVVEAFSSLFRQFLSGTRYLLTMFKVAFLLVIELGLFPLMCGWWLDICTIKMLGTTMSKRVEFFLGSPLLSCLFHWAVGIAYMLQISIFVSLLRGVLRNGVLYFLRDPSDPNYNPFRDLIDDPVHKHARRVLLSVAVYGSLIVMLVFMPVKLALRLAPSLFPLDITLSDPFTEIPADVLLFQLCIPFALKHFRPRATIKAILHQWFTVAGWALDLTEFLLPLRGEDRGNDENENENGDQGRQAEQAVEQLLLPEAAERVDHEIVGSPRTDDVIDDQRDSEYSFVVRIVLLLVMAWFTLLVFNSSFIVLPVYLGRLLFNSVPQFPFTHGVKCNDLYAFHIGFYAIWSAVAGSRYVLDYAKRHQMRLLLSQIWKWSVIILKSSGLLAIWILVIPVLIGLLFELLVIVPLRVPIDESPVFLLYQDWALGLIFLKVWTRLVMMEQMAPLVDEQWRSKLERVRQDGFSGLRCVWVLREVVGPIVIKLLTALCVPYVFARGMFPLLGYPLVVNSAVYRFTWLGCLLLATVAFCVRRFHLWFTSLHNAIRDDRYLIGRRLHDFGDPPHTHQD